MRMFALKFFFRVVGNSVAARKVKENKRRESLGDTIQADIFESDFTAVEVQGGERCKLGDVLEAHGGDAATIRQVEGLERREFGDVLETDIADLVV